MENFDQYDLQPYNINITGKYKISYFSKYNVTMYELYCPKFNVYLGTVINIFKKPSNLRNKYKISVLKLHKNLMLNKCLKFL